MDGNAAVCGLLSIARCLYDAIHRLEKKAMKAEDEGNEGGGRELKNSILKVRGRVVTSCCIDSLNTGAYTHRQSCNA